MLKNVQSLASIVNNPKQESMFKKVKTILKHKIQGGPSPYYSAMAEKDVEDSSLIPLVKPHKDFRDYKKKLAHPAVAHFHDNHNHEADLSPGESLPFAVAEPAASTSAIEGQFWVESFRLPAKFFKIFQYEEEVVAEN